jgi:hypothetical protein
MKNACRSEILIPGEIYTAAQEFALIGFKVGKARPRLANSPSEGPADFPGGRGRGGVSFPATRREKYAPREVATSPDRSDVFHLRFRGNDVRGARDRGVILINLPASPITLSRDSFLSIDEPPFAPVFRTWRMSHFTELERN